MVPLELDTGSVPEQASHTDFAIFMIAVKVHNPDFVGRGSEKVSH